MTTSYRSICLVSSGMHEHHLRLQPWRYLHEVARQLRVQGHRVTIISDGTPVPTRGVLEDVPIVRLPSVSSPRWRMNEPLRATLRQLAPQVTLWHVGLTSFLHQEVPDDVPGSVVGIFTSPLYQPHEIARLGVSRIAKGYKLSAMHVLGTFAPRSLFRTSLRRSRMDRLIVQSQATWQRLVDFDLDTDRVRLIPPGVDAAWRAAPLDEAMRAQLGYSSTDSVVLYFGSPAPLRGLHALVRAISIARRSDPSLKLLVLSRRHSDELLREDNDLRRLLNTPELQPHVKVVSGFLNESALVRRVAASDIVALPFELIPSDAPLSLLEAQALGKPVVTTNLGCLAELVDKGPRYLAQPGDPRSLANALVAAARDMRAQGTNPSTAASFEPRSWRQVGQEWSNLVQSL